MQPKPTMRLITRLKLHTNVKFKHLPQDLCLNDLYGLKTHLWFSPFRQSELNVSLRGRPWQQRRDAALVCQSVNSLVGLYRSTLLLLLTGGNSVNLTAVDGLEGLA